MRRGWTALAGTALVAATLAGCGSSSESGDSTTAVASTPVASYPTDKQEICDARDQLSASVSALTDPDLLTTGVTGITDAVNQVKSDLETLNTAAKQDYQPLIQAVQTSVDELQTAAASLGSGAVAENMTAVGTAIAAVGTSTSALFTELQTSCG